MAHAAEDLGRVLLDPLPRRAAVARLAAREVALHPVAVDGQSGGHAGHDPDDAGAVRLAAGDELEVHRHQRYPKALARVAAANNRVNDGAAP